MEEAFPGQMAFSTPKKTNLCEEYGSPSTQKSMADVCHDKENESGFKIGAFNPETSSATSVKKPKRQGDRFIPLRKSGKTPYSLGCLEEADCFSNKGSPVKQIEEELNGKDQSESLISSFLRTEILGMSEERTKQNVSFQNTNMLKFGGKISSFDPLEIVSSFEKHATVNICKKKTIGRKIPKLPFKVLDAPALQDDFYLNLLDWSESNFLSVGLASSVYLWSGANNRVFRVCDLGSEDTVTSVSWARKGDLLGVGTNSGEIHVWDINKVKRVRCLEGHNSRVGAISWSNDSLISGSRDKSILLRDIRCADNYHERLLCHSQEVCGLKWSPDSQMFASGGNDNKMYIWTPKSATPIFKTSAHKAAVKALAWSPHQHGLLASGGGTADKCIRFWNAHKGQMVNCIDTGSQVCNLLFSKNVNELVSTHGYTDNQIHVWSYPQMKKLSTLTGHTYRVLYLSMSPDGRHIVTGAGDETLRFWDLYPKSLDGSGNMGPSFCDLDKISIR